MPLLLYKTVLRQLLRFCKCLAVHLLTSRVVNFDLWCLQAGLMTQVRACIQRCNNLAGLLRSRIRRVTCYEDYTKVQVRISLKLMGMCTFVILFLRCLQALCQRNFSKTLWGAMPRFTDVVLCIFVILSQNTTS